MVESKFASTGNQLVKKGLMIKGREILNRKRLLEGKSPILKDEEETPIDDSLLDYCNYIFQIAYLWEKLGTPPRAGGLEDQDPIELRLVSVVLSTRDRCEAERMDALSRESAAR